MKKAMKTCLFCNIRLWCSCQAFCLFQCCKVMQFSCRLLKERLKLEESLVNWIPTRLKGVRQNQRFFRICPSSSFLVWVQFS
jgi:hypothetical protein